MDLLLEIAKQGLGWLVAAYIFKLYKDEVDKNAKTIERITEVITGFGKDLTNGTTNNTNAINALTAVVNSKLK